MSIANCENMISNAERRGLVLGETPVAPRISDLAYLAASARGKIELTMSEDDGQEDKVVGKLIGEAVKNIFEANFDVKRFRTLVEWFEGGHSFVVGDRLASADYAKRLSQVPLLKKEVEDFLQEAVPEGAQKRAHDPLAASAVEFILEGLHVENRLNKNQKAGEIIFKR
jgi:magnesium chelatase subunit I